MGQVCKGPGVGTGRHDGVTQTLSPARGLNSTESILRSTGVLFNREGDLDAAGYKHTPDTRSGQV